MAETIAYDDMVRMLRAAATKINASVDLLSKLDSFAGDGDHGTTMKRAMGAIEKAIVDSPARDLKGLLTDVGWAVLGVDGGSTGPLLGTFFTGMADAAGERASLDAAAAAEVFEAGLAGLRKQTKAQVGDKTMIDALVPAVEALRAAAGAGDGVAVAMAKAAEAAERGAASTTDLQAKFGRARNLGERSKGSPDPGATSASLIFRGFAEALAGE